MVSLPILTSSQEGGATFPPRFRTSRAITAPEPRSDSHCCGPMEPKMKNLLKFVKDESGATAIEYGLIAAGISVAIIAVVQGLGTNLKNTFSSVSTALK